MKKYSRLFYRLFRILIRDLWSESKVSPGAIIQGDPSKYLLDLALLLSKELYYRLNMVVQLNLEKIVMFFQVRCC